MSETTATLLSLRNRYLSPLDEHFARAVGRIGGENRAEVLLAAALASRFVRNGHVCLDLARFAREPELVGEEKIAIAWPALAPWLAALRASSLISSGGAFGRWRRRRSSDSEKKNGNGETASALELVTPELARSSAARKMY
jgi:hypothetical protein